VEICACLCKKSFPQFLLATKINRSILGEIADRNSWNPAHPRDAAWRILNHSNPRILTIDDPTRQWSGNHAR
jgi:hypothetical protein